MSAWSRILLVPASVALAVSIYVPIWRIDLDAPQYPEGLNLKIYADKIGGNVDIINGLNHYIGMKTLHTDDFVEFTVLPYLIGFFSVFALCAAIVGRRKFLYSLLFSFIVFGVVAMVDFWRWEYNYGHNLDPNAAIIVPGMAYQPPLIGFKQLLNFGAYSIPDTGGWLMLGAGVCMLLASVMEFRKQRSAKIAAAKKVRAMAAAAIVTLFLMSSCKPGPQPIRLNADNCSNCEMTISDKRFATELLTNKGKVYKFDDLKCMLGHMKENSTQEYSGIYVTDYLNPDVLLKVEQAFIIAGESVGSPMGGNMAAFSNKDSAEKYSGKLAASPVDWSVLKP